MTELLLVFVIGFLIVAAATIFGPRLGVASPLVLVAIGVAASYLPLFGSIHIEPELVLEGILPPLLYAAAGSVPTMNFRREFGTITGLSVLLVVGNALLLGVFFTLVIPSLGFAWGVALGAIISPTDAVATSIVKKTSASKRVVDLLNGESLLNDATALVLLRTSIIAAAAGFSFWGSVGTFGYAVAIAGVIGWLVGWLNLELRKYVTNPTANTVLSFTVPFVASIPAGLLGGSGLVAAVVAGLILSRFGPRYLSPQNRLSDFQNWRTVELLLEGAVFLTMGLQIRQIVTSAQQNEPGVAIAVLIAASASVLTILLRVAYVVPLLGALHLLSRRGEKTRPQLLDTQQKLRTSEGGPQALDDRNGRTQPARRPGLRWSTKRIARGLADIDYVRRQPLGWREGATMVWAGMRGAITVAAAQTLPEDAPFRSSLVLIAFTVAVMSLAVQGGTLGPFLRLIRPRTSHTDDGDYLAGERARVADILRSMTREHPGPTRLTSGSDEAHREAQRAHRLKLFVMLRAALLDARDGGTYDTEALEEALAKLDADQIAFQLRSGTAT